MRIFLSIVSTIVVLLTWTVAAEAEWRKWTSDKGSVIEGKMIELTANPRDVMATKVKIETSDGRAVTVVFRQLSPADQAWLANRHGDILAGGPTRKPEAELPPKEQVRILPMENVENFDPAALLSLPAGVSFKRQEIPSLADFTDRHSDGVDPVTNHLFWLCKAGYMQMEPERNDEKTWQKLHRKVSSRFGGGDHWNAEAVAKLAIEVIKREGKGVLSIRPWRVTNVTPTALDTIEGNPALVLFGCKALDGNDYKWSLVIPILEANGRNLTFAYQGERIPARLDDRKPAPGAVLKDGQLHSGYELVLDPGDSSRLATRLRKEELRIIAESFYIIEFGLSQHAKKVP